MLNNDSAGDQLGRESGAEGRHGGRVGTHGGNRFIPPRFAHSVLEVKGIQRNQGWRMVNANGYMNRNT